MLRSFTFKIVALFCICSIAFTSNAQVNANFSVNTTQGCTPLLIQFTDLSTSSPSGIASWSWDFGDNSPLSNVQNPARIFNAAGVFTITLIVTDSLGTSDTLVMPNLLSISSSPTAEFIGVPSEGCVPVAVQFTDQSTAGSNPITSWQWSFGTGSASNLQNPAFTYNNVNNYTVTLTVTDQNGCSNQAAKSGYVKVAGIPQAGFTAATTQFCSFPATVNFANTTNVPSGANMEYTWYFGDGDSSSLQSPSHTYNAAGQYDVMLISTDTSSSSNCSDTILVSDYIEIFNNSQITFNRSPSSGCDNVTVQFTNTTVCPSVNWSWDFGDNSPISNLESPSHTYSSPGSYDVIFSALVDGVALVDTCFNCVTVNVTPSADYTTTGTIATCVMPINASFAGTSDNPNATYAWDFGDGNTDNTQNTSHTYTEAGDYPVVLTVTSPEGCSNIVVKDTVFARPIVANYVENRVSSCIGNAIEFLDSTVSYYPITAYSWDFEDTTSIDQNPTINFSDTGAYTVTLIVTNSLGCVDTFTNIAEIGDSVAIDFTADDTIACIDQDINFLNLTDPAVVGLVTQWTWDFGDGGTSSQFQPTYAYSDTGTYIVTLTAGYNNCDSKVERVDYITIGPPEANFEADRDCAAPLQVTFIDKSIGADTYSWDFGVGSLTNDTSNLSNPSYTYPGAGTYTIKLTVSNSQTGCTHEKSRTLILNSAEDVTISISDTAGCTPLVISVSNTSSLASYHWTAPGAMISDTALAQPTLTYNTAGVFDSIKLVVTHPTGCIEEILLPDTIRTSSMIAAISANTTSGCIPLTVNFTDMSFSTSNIASYVWDFGNGDSSMVQNPNYTYTAAGTFQPTLTLTDSVGCVKTANLNNSIIPTAPYVEFLSDTIACVGQEISFANLSTGIGLSHSWDFGDATTSTTINPLHTFTTEGSYNVILTITDINNCSNSFTRTVVIANPVSNFSANNTSANCQALSVQFNDNSQNAISWLWDFGDSTTSTLQNPIKVYTEPGSYDVCLIVTSQSGCKDTLCQAGFIQISGPSADFSFTPNSGCPGTVVNFTATGQNVTKFIFVWGDFTTTEVAGTGGNDTITMSHTYIDGGNFVPAIVAEDIQSCQQTFLASDTISIEDFAVNIVKSADMLCDSGMVQISTSIASISPLSSTQWTYGPSSTTSTNNTLNLNITTPGVYPINLTASNAACTRTAIDSIVVYNSPKAHYGITPLQACVPQMVQFTDSSTVVNDTIAAYIWDLGNGTIDSIANTSYLYDSVASYNVQFKVVAGSGCADSSQAIVDIFPLPIANAGNDTIICEEQSTNLLASGGASYVWNAAPSLSCTNCANPIASPTQTTDYIVTVTSINGCTDTDTVTVIVNPKPNAAIANLPISACNGASISFTDNSSISTGTITSWNWDFGNLITDNVQNPMTTYNVAGNFTVELIVNSAIGCSDTTSGQVIINQSPTASANFDTYICQGDEATLTASGGATYQWSPSASLDCDTCSTVIATPLTTTVYTLTATSINGCTDTDTVRVDVSPYPAPPLTVSNDTTICLGDTIQIFAGGGVSVLDYQWDVTRVGLSCYTNCNNPFASPTQTTTYIVTLTGLGGCTAVDSITVTVITPNFDLVTSDSETICQGEAAPLNTITGTNHQWLPFDGLSCVYCPNPMASPEDTTTYTITAIVNGCYVIDTVTVNVIDPSTVNAGDDVGLCPGNSIQLNASGTGIVSWSPGATLSDATILNPIASPTQSTDYVLTVDNGICNITDTVSVLILEAAVLEVEDIEICDGESVVLPVNGFADSYIWTPSDGLDTNNVQNPVASPTETTTYTVTASLANCASNTKDLTVTVNPRPTVVGFPVQEVFTGQNTLVKLDVEYNPSFDYQWWTSQGPDLISCTNCHNPTIVSPTAAGRIYVQVTNLDGCTTIDSIDITLINDCAESLIILPNSFTPNNDGLNDRLFVRGSSLEDITTFKIFSRSGVNVFSTTNIADGWDGTYNGRLLNTGTYVYFVEAICPLTGTPVRKNGNVLLLRN